MAGTRNVRNYARNARALGCGRMRRWRHSCCADRLARVEVAATLPALRDGSLLAHSYRHVTSDFGRKRNGRNGEGKRTGGFQASIARSGRLGRLFHEIGLPGWEGKFSQTERMPSEQREYGFLHSSARSIWSRTESRARHDTPISVSRKICGSGLNPCDVSRYALSRADETAVPFQYISSPRVSATTFITG